MGGISSSVGMFSGIDSAALIEQLLAVEARPKKLAQTRMAQIQTQQAAYLDIASRITAIKNSAAGFRLNNTFQSKSATSSNDNTLKATADKTAVPGNYTFLVDRLVSTQQALSRGFANKDVSGLGVTTLTFESSQARLDRDVELSDLNDGQGVRRGRIIVTDSANRAATIDLSRATSVNDVLEAINANGTAQVTASVSGGRFVLSDNAGGALTVADGSGSTMATSLGLAGVAASGGKVTGNVVYRLSGATTLSSINDGNGVAIRASTSNASSNFKISVNGTQVGVNLSDTWDETKNPPEKNGGPVSDLAGVVSRINSAMTAAGFTGITASVDGENNRLQIIDSTNSRTLSVIEGSDSTAADLGLPTTISGSMLFGGRVLAGMQTTMVKGLTGFAKASHDGLLNFKLRNDAEFSAAVDTTGSVQDMLAEIEEASKVGGVKQVRAELDSKGTGIVLTDLTPGSGKLRITGTAGQDAAAALGVSTGPAGQDGASKASGNLQRQYMSRSTALTSLNNGKGVGTGEFRITDATGASSLVRVSDTTKTLGDLIDVINSRGLKVTASINSTGDGVTIREKLAAGETAGTQKIKVEEAGSALAKSLNLLGTASDVGASNVIDGSFERKVTLTGAETLQQLTDKINAAKGGVTASVVRDGTGSSPFRLSLTSNQTGSAGRFVIDSGSVDLGLTTLDRGRDARVFFGSSDAATGIAVTSTTNTIDSVLAGVKIDLKGTSESPVTLAIASDVSGIEAAVGAFVTTFNTAIERIESQTKYDKDSNRRAALLGDSTMLELRSQLYSTVQGVARGAVGQYTRMAEVGVTIGEGAKLKLDATKLREALANDPASVEALFTARTAADDSRIDLGDGVTVRNPNAGNTFSTLSVMGQVEEMGKRYVEGTGAVLFARQDQLREQVKLQESRIAAFDLRLESRRAVLQKQFINMEKALGKLRNQQSALGSLPAAG
jgi:flagellar hook-associated protein 2